MPKVSIIIPVYCVEEYLKECLDSILSQTLNDLEIILIDDGSKDKCPQIIDEYAQKDDRIIAVHKENGGYGSAMNVGLRKATGEYIGIVEPDDYIESNMYEDLYNIAKQFDSDIVKSCFYDNLQSKEEQIILKTKWADDIIPQDKSFTVKECGLFLQYHPSIWSCIYKREFLEKHNIRFVEAPGSGWTDNPFQVQTMCLAERINYTPKAYYYWRRLNKDASDDLKDYTIPFKRSDEIHQWLDENNINDEEILSNLYRRELAYIQIVLGKRDLENVEDAVKLVRGLLGHIDKKLLRTANNIKPSAKREYEKIFKSPIQYRKKIILKKNRQNLISFRWDKHEKRIVLFGKSIKRGIKSSNVKIIQVFHKNFPRIKSPIVISMHVGKATANKDIQESLKDMIGDDSIQDNISSQNDIYCELTAQYFAWKNLNLLSNLNYIGFMHYRRVFNFSNRTKNVKNKDYSIQNVDKNIKNQDIILIEKMPCYSKIAMSHVEDVKTHWKLEHNIKDLDIIYNRVAILYPEYKKSFDVVLKSPSIHWYNMFIMRTGLFKKYSEWLFSILDVDVNSFIEKPRIKGFLAEILLNVFIEKNKNNLKIKEVPSFKIEEPKTLKNTFIENIFSIKHQSSKLHKKYIVFTILGLKIKVKNPKNKMLSFNTIQDGKLIKADSLMLAYNKQINERQYLECTENIIKSIPQNELTQDELLIYMDSLVTNNEYSRAEKILKRYVNQYNFSGIWSFYHLANFAKSIGYDNDLNNRAVDIYANILSNDIENKFKTLIENQAVAIIGNGPSEIGTGHGLEIDSHDIVIRMNNYRIEGFENDYGSKCDIWARGIGASDVIDKTKDYKYKACLWAANISNFKISYPILKILERDIKNNNMVTLAINNDVGLKIKNETGVYFPTTGFNTILYLLKECNPKSIDCYGFSFNQKNIDRYATHYFNDRNKKEAIKRSCVHKFNDESLYLKQFLRENGGKFVK